MYCESDRLWANIFDWFTAMCVCVCVSLPASLQHIHLWISCPVLVCGVIPVESRGRYRMLFVGRSGCNSRAPLSPDFSCTSISDSAEMNMADREIHTGKSQSQLVQRSILEVTWWALHAELQFMSLVIIMIYSSNAFVLWDFFNIIGQTSIHPCP